jgi:hypothetical protein
MVEIVADQRRKDKHLNIIPAFRRAVNQPDTFRGSGSL